MHGSITKWLACVLAVVFACSAGIADAQGVTPMLTYDPGYTVMSSTTTPGQQATDARLVSRYADDASLGDRVAGLEAALQDMQADQAAAAAGAAGRPSVEVGGRIHADFAIFDQNVASFNQAGDALNSFEMRRARIHLKGEAFHVIDYKIEMDFSGNVDFADVYLTIKELPWIQNVRVGHHYEPWGLERQTSNRFTTFMERSVLTDVGQVGGRKVGASAFGWNETETVTFRLGVFAAQQAGENPPRPPVGADDDGNTAIDARATWLPWYDEATEGRGLLHVGVCYTYRDIASDAVARYGMTQRPEAHLAPLVVNTGALNDVNAVNAALFEGALVYGPLSIQGEYAWYDLNRTANPNPTLHGGYVFVSYFLTGEHRPYKRTVGVFNRVKPFENFFRVRDEDGYVQTGKGAWELGYRISYLDLNDANTQGGQLTDHTVGVNWYLNPYTRIMVNYIHSNVEDHPVAAGVGTMNALMTRFQIDF